MKIDIIYTFEESEQQRLNLPFVESILSNKDSLIDFATSAIDQRELGDLIKISCCVEWFTEREKNIQLPEWYFECNGKIWVDDLEKWRKERDIKSSVSNDFLTEFASYNS